MIGSSTAYVKKWKKPFVVLLILSLSRNVAPCEEALYKPSVLLILLKMTQSNFKLFPSESSLYILYVSGQTWM